jgi:hypothetical protein
MLIFNYILITFSCFLSFYLCYTRVLEVHLLLKLASLVSSQVSQFQDIEYSEEICCCYAFYLNFGIWGI